MNCMKFPRGMILEKDNSLYYIINEEVNHKALQGLQTSTVPEKDIEDTSSNEYFCFKNNLAEDCYFVVDCRKSIFLNNEECKYVYSTTEDIYSLCVTLYMLNAFGITPIEYMTNIAMLAKQNNAVSEVTEKEEITDDIHEENIPNDDIKNISIDTQKALADYFNRANDSGNLLSPYAYKMCVNALNIYRYYNKLYHEIYRYLYNVSKSKMIEIIKESRKEYESQHMNKKE